MKKLLNSLRVGVKTAKNRLMLAPMVCYGYCPGNDGFVSDKHVAHYEKMAKGGTGIIVVEAACVCKNGRLSADQLGIWDDEFISGLRQIADVIHKYGALAIIQIHHAGLKTYADSQNPPIAPSNYNETSSFLPAKEMSASEIEDISIKFKNSAIRAEKAGFDGVEVHGCHGYLINQFLSDKVNSRTDKYGVNKELFGVDILKSVKANTSSDFIAGVRIPGNEPDIKTSTDFATAFEEAGADYLSVSYGFTREVPKDLDNEKTSYSIPVLMGSEIRDHVSVPVAVVFEINSPEEANEIIESDIADIAASGRGLLVDSDWIVKMESNEDVRKCLKCSPCRAHEGIEICNIILG